MFIPQREKTTQLIRLQRQSLGSFTNQIILPCLFAECSPYVYHTYTHTNTHTRLRKAFVAGNIITPALVLLAAHRAFNTNMLWLC